MSCVKYFCSTFVALVAIFWGTILILSSKPRGILIDLEKKKASLFSPSQLHFTEEQLKTYKEEGILVLREFLTKDETLAIRNAGNEASDNGPVTIMDLMFRITNMGYQSISFDLWRINPTLAALNLQALPNVAAQLVHNNEPLRLLRDALFRVQTGSDGIVCGWHVDDEGFWPAAAADGDESENDSEKSTNGGIGGGTTIWMALDDTSIEQGGGLTLVPASRMEPEWFAKCLPVTQERTCDMETRHPECHKYMESKKVEYDMSAGDAIIWDRRIFHRTVEWKTTHSSNTTTTTTTMETGDADADAHVDKMRYTVRYVPAESVKSMGAIHHSVAQGSSFDSPYYPQVWPHLVPSEVEALRTGLDVDFTFQNLLLSLRNILVTKVRDAVLGNESTEKTTVLPSP